MSVEDGMLGVGDEGLGNDWGLLMAAHELKSPLTLVRQLAIELGSSEASINEHQRILQQLRLTSEKMLRLTTDLTKSTSTQMHLFPTESLQPRAVIQDVTSELGPLYEAHGRQLSIRNRAKIPPVIANRDLLRRVLCNFADNALHYTSDESVVELFMQLQRERSVVRIGVRDYASVAGKNDKSGTDHPASSSGLGLRIAQQFASAMNGTIGAIKHRNGGASFYIDLPMSRQMTLL